jgi:two-component system, cell cycle response regulator
MPTPASPTFLLASAEPALVAAIKPVLIEAGAQVEVVFSAHHAWASMTGPTPPELVLLDERLAGIGPPETIVHLLTGVRTHEYERRFPILLIVDTVTQEWLSRVAEGLIDDLIQRAAGSSCWRLRIELALRSFRMERETELLRKTAALDLQMDRLTGVYNRETLLAMFFRETDHMQRLNSSMSIVLFDIDEFGIWNLRLGEGACDQLLRQVAKRTARLLRSYDLLGRPGNDEFLVALPDCGIVNTILLAERLRRDVFGSLFHAAGESIRLSACFGIAPCYGRSPGVVLREAEEALRCAKAAGPESIECAAESVRPAPSRIMTLPSGAGDEAIAW